MSKKFLQLLSVSGLVIVTLISASCNTFAAEDTNCIEQQKLCHKKGCDQLIEPDAIEKCKSMGWSPHGDFESNHISCYEGCRLNHTLGEKDQKGCHHSPCMIPEAYKRKRGPGGL